MDTKNISFYIVGGAVRDALMGKEPHDYDIVVEGATPEQMQELGFIQVGKSFPVFLHPVTHMEFALCRKEIKTGDKHTDFEFVWDGVTINEDLERRDFTINALAVSCDVDIDTGKITPITLDKEKKIENCYIIDNHGGFQDLRNNIIKVVNPTHFIEDPLRVLRACRFAAQLGFYIHSSTMGLLQRMVNEGMLDHLTRPRIDNETFKAMAPGCNSELYFLRMKECGALKVLYPEIDKLFDNAENVKYHSTGNTGLHVMAALRHAQDKEIHTKFGVLYHDIYKPVAYNSDTDKHTRHDTEDALKYFEDTTKNKTYSYKIKKSCKVAIQYHMKMWTLFDGMNVKHFVDMIGDITRGFDKNYKYLLEDLLDVCEADDASDKTEACIQKGQTKERCQLLRKIALEVFDICEAVHFKDIPDYTELDPLKVKEKQRTMRISMVKFYLKDNHYQFNK